MVAIARRTAPMRFEVPSTWWLGPYRTSCREPTCSIGVRVPRGNSGWWASGPQWYPRPGASAARARGAPIITASAPMAMALTMSPDRPIPPSAITCTYRPPDSSR